jgi:hypothetical protein
MSVDVRAQIVEEVRDVLLAIPEATAEMFVGRLAGARRVSEGVSDFAGHLLGNRSRFLFFYRK